MSSEFIWEKSTLRNAGITLIDCDHRTPQQATEGYPYIAIPQLKDGHIRLDGVRLISKSDYLDWTKKLKPQADDVIVVRRCNSGDSAVVPAGLECAIGQNLVILRSDGQRIYPKFLRWLLRGPDWWEQVEKFINVGAVFDSLKCREIPEFELTIPPLEVQKEIATVLGSIDARIELLRETNATLEAMAQALFKSWFVDFNPVHANALASDCNAEIQTVGALLAAPNSTKTNQGAASSAPTVNALFPATFTASPQGLVPEGWSPRSLDEIAEYLNGLALQKFPPTGENDLPVIKIAQLRKGDTVGADLAGRNLKPEYIIQDGDVLFSWSGSLEVEIWCGGEGALNQHLFKVTSKEYPKWFYYLWTRYHLANFKLIAASKATTMGHIQRKHLTEAMTVVPSTEVLNAANEVFNPLIEQLINNALVCWIYKS